MKRVIRQIVSFITIMLLCVDLLNAMNCSIVPKNDFARVNKRIERYFDRDMVWVKTSDAQSLRIPQADTDQMQVLKLLHLQQKGKNSKDNPLDLSKIEKLKIDKEHVQFLQHALNNSGNWEKFYTELEKNSQKRDELISLAGTIGATSLLSLLADSRLSGEMQIKISAEIISDTIAWLTKKAFDKYVERGCRGSYAAWQLTLDGFKVSILENGVVFEETIGGQAELVQNYQNCCMNLVRFCPHDELKSFNHDLLIWNIEIDKFAELIKNDEKSLCNVIFHPEGTCNIQGCIIEEDEVEKEIFSMPLTSEIVDFMKRDLTIFNAHFLHRLYAARKNNTPIKIDKTNGSIAYAALPENMQKMVVEYCEYRDQLPQEEQRVLKKQLELSIQETQATIEEELKDDIIDFGTLTFSNIGNFEGMPLFALKDANGFLVYKNKSFILNSKITKVIKALKDEPGIESIRYKALTNVLDQLKLEKEFEDSGVCGFTIADFDSDTD